MSAPLPFPTPPVEPASRIEALKVFVRALRIEAEIGVYAHEHGRSQPLVIDVELDLIPPARCEHIADTVNYEGVVERARALAAKGHVKLIETFAQTLAESLLAEAPVRRVRVRIEKPQALADHADAAGVEIVVSR